jgi:hypothetical protein
MLREQIITRVAAFTQEKSAHLCLEKYVLVPVGVQAHLVRASTKDLARFLAEFARV